MTKKLSSPTPEPPSVPIGYISTSNNATLTPPGKERKSIGAGTVFFVLAVLGGGGYAAWNFLPVKDLVSKVVPAAIGSPAGPTVSRTLTIRPGLLVTVTGDLPIQFTGFRIYDSGAEVPCMRGWLGVALGNVNGHLDCKSGDNPFSDSCLRLRFCTVNSGPKALTISCDEGNPSIRELDMADGVAECLYRGGTGKLNLSISDGRLRVEPSAFAQARN